MEETWVKSIYAPAGVGEKYRVASETHQHYCCFSPHHELWLPKHEYVICDAPTQWEDVTIDCGVGPAHGVDRSSLLCRREDIFHPANVKKFVITHHAINDGIYLSIERRK